MGDREGTAITEQVLSAITARIEDVPSEVWEAGRAKRDPLWQALDDIDDPDNQDGFYDGPRVRFG